jgi:hypothetical protein
MLFPLCGAIKQQAFSIRGRLCSSDVSAEPEVDFLDPCVQGQGEGLL